MQSFRGGRRETEDAIHLGRVGDFKEAETGKREFTVGPLNLSLTDLQILSLLGSFPMTGYELRKRISPSFGRKISFGTLYPRLRYFEKLEIVKSTYADPDAGRRGIKYELTKKGRSNLEIQLKTFRNTLQTIESLLQKTPP